MGLCNHVAWNMELRCLHVKPRSSPRQFSHPPDFFFYFSLLPLNNFAVIRLVPVFSEYMDEESGYGNPLTVKGAPPA